MKIIFLFILAFSILPQVVLASGSDCTMTPVPIDIKRISHQPTVKSYTVNTNKLELTALLKNGTAVKLTHMGCYDSGGIVTEWFESDVPMSDVDRWVKEAVILANTFFDPFVFKIIDKSLKSNKYNKEITENRLVITGSSNETFSYTIVFTPVEHGVMLSIKYNFSG